MRYIPALDGLRAIAVLAVMAYHCHLPGSDFGFLGVDVFFVLSGFLITSILLKQEAAGGIRLGDFYLRRARRLYPALLVMVGLYLAMAPYVWPKENAATNAAIALLYLSDYGMAFWGRPAAIGHTWSLAVEEHFYLIWPLLLPMVTKLPRKAALYLFAVLYIAASVWRMYCNVNMGVAETYFRFDTRLSGLILGCALSMMPAMPRVPWAWLSVPAAAFAAWTFEQNTLGIGMTAVEWLAACVILGCMQGSYRALAHPWIVYIGKISYGLYLFHILARAPVLPWIVGWPQTALTMIAISFPLAILSYHTIETRFRKTCAAPMAHQAA